MKKAYIAICALFCSASSLASASESCPSVDSVTLRGGVYTAPAQRAGDEWIAVSSSFVPSPLETFEGAVFYPENNQQGSVGRIGHCEYKTKDRSRINLFYRQSATSTELMRLVNAENWMMVESGLGLIFYECTAADPSVCAFSIVY